MQIWLSQLKDLEKSCFIILEIAFIVWLAGMAEVAHDLWVDEALMAGLTQRYPLF